jgi:D-3-phosphoglycerate dehydrogenase / 2-oxoglutarate reductase
MKTVAFGGIRLFMKFPDLRYFRERATREGLAVAEAREADDAAFAAAVAGAEAIAVIDRRLDAAIIGGLERCELIITLSVGYDCVDVAAATARGIAVSNTPAYCTDEVAAHAMTLLLAVARKIHTTLPRTRAGEWDYNFARPIGAFRGRTLGIVGLGRIGRALVPKARGFGMRVVAYDPYVPDDLFTLLGVERHHDLDDLLREADYVSIHSLLTPETEGMIGARELGLMKPEAVIVNTARGRIWDEEAVCDALRDGRIAGVGADVLGTEPPDRDHPLLREERALVTPHVAWYSEESFQDVMVQGMDEIVRVLAGHRPRYVVNPGIYFGGKR